MRTQSGQWRFILILLFIGLIIFAVIRAPKFLNAQLGIIYEENFDTGFITGAINGQNGWSGNTNWLVVDTEPKLGSFSLRNTSATINQSIASETFSSVEDEYSWSFDIYLDDDTDGTTQFVNGISLVLLEGSVKENISFRRSATSSVHSLNYGSSGTFLQEVPQKQWLTIDVNSYCVADIVTFDVRVDGGNWHMGLDNGTSCEPVSRMNFNHISHPVTIDNLQVFNHAFPEFGVTRIISLDEHQQTLATTTAVVTVNYALDFDDQPRYSHIFYDFKNIDTGEQWTTTDPSFPDSGISFGQNEVSFGGVIPPNTLFPPGMYLVIVGFVADPEYWGFSPFEDPDCFWDPFSPDHDCVLASPVVHHPKSFEFVVGSSIYGEYQDGTLVQPPAPEFEIDCSMETGLDFVVCKVGEILSDLFSWILDQIKAFFGIAGAVLQNAFNALKNHFFSRAPWGYGLRIYEIICGEFSISTLRCAGPATSTLPALIVTAPTWVEEHTGANFGSGKDWAPWGENRFETIKETIEEQEVENIASSTDAWQSFLSKWTLLWNFLFGIFILYIVFGVRMTLDDANKVEDRYKGL